LMMLVEAMMFNAVECEGRLPRGVIVPRSQVF
jgi:hypothetical protein